MKLTKSYIKKIISETIQNSVQEVRADEAAVASMMHTWMSDITGNQHIIELSKILATNAHEDTIHGGVKMETARAFEGAREDLIKSLQSIIRNNFLDEEEEES